MNAPSSFSDPSSVTPLPERAALNENVEALVARAVEGDADAFGELYLMYRGQILRYIRRRVGDPTEAEDLMGRVFLKAWQAMPRYQQRGRPFAGWLFRLAHNQVVDHLRTKRETVELPEQHPSMVEHGPEEYAHRRALYDEVADALQDLTPDQRRLIVLKFLEGLDNRTIAALMGKGEGAVRALQMRSLAALRRAMAARETAAEDERFRRGAA